MAFKNYNQQKAAFANMNRTRQAVDSDNSKKAMNTLSNTPENVKVWSANPRRIDIEGIDTPTIKGQSINTKKDNSSIGQEKPKEKATMELIELKQELESVYSDVVQKHKEYKNSEDGTDKQYAAMQKFNNAVKRRDELRMKIREIETGVEQTMGGGYEGITAKDIDTTPMKRDPEHEKRIRDTDEWQRKHDSD